MKIASPTEHLVGWGWEVPDKILNRLNFCS